MKRNRRILSIDFDYFIDTDIDTRNNKFPDGVDNKPKDVLKNEWNIMYTKYPEIQNIGVTENSFNICCNNLYMLRFGKVLIADSHKDIAKLFPLIDPEDELEVIHIDFHHDNYISGGSEVDCANWVRHLMQERPNTRLEWLRREDSETVSLEGEFPYQNTLGFVIDGEFDYIFLCFSPEWTPPHLLSKFMDLCKSVVHLEHI